MRISGLFAKITLFYWISADFQVKILRKFSKNESLENLLEIFVGFSSDFFLNVFLLNCFAGQSPPDLVIYILLGTAGACARAGHMPTNLEF